MLDIYAKSDVGRVRSSNQDCYSFKVLDDEFAWVVVCDGMGGTKFGGLASSMAKEIITDSFVKKFSNNSFNFNDEYIKDAIVGALVNANKRIFDRSCEKQIGKMGTTVVAGVVVRSVLHVAHIGDSRAYVVSENYIKQITEDHSVVQEMLKYGKITFSQARSSLQKNILTRALGIESSVEVDYSKILLSLGAAILLRTDGLTNYFDEKALLDYFRNYKAKKQDLVCALVNDANSKGGSDNITAILISDIKGNKISTESGGSSN